MRVVRIGDPGDPPRSSVRAARAIRRDHLPHGADAFRTLDRYGVGSSRLKITSGSNSSSAINSRHGRLPQPMGRCKSPSP